MKTNKPPREQDEHREVTKLLKSLQKVDAPPGFEADLMRRINREETAADEKPRGFFAKFFTWRTLVPSTAGLAVVVLLIFMINDQQQKQSMESPLFSEPSLNEEVIASNDGGVLFDEEKGEFSGDRDAATEDMATDESDEVYETLPTEPLEEVRPNVSVGSNAPEGRESGRNDMLREMEETTRGAIEEIDDLVPEVNPTPPPLPIDTDRNETGLTGGGTNEPVSAPKKEKKMLNYRQVFNTFEEQRIIDSLRNKTFGEKDTTLTETR